MLTLHSTSQLVKQIIKWSIIIIVSLYALNTLFKVGIAIKNSLFPAPLEQPDARFGKLPQIRFPNSAFKNSYTYSIDTLTGTLPEFPDRMKVFKIVQPQLLLLNSERAEQKAKQFGFKDEIQRVLPHKKITPVVFEWNRTQPNFTQRLTMNIQNYNFQLDSSFENESVTPNRINAGIEKKSGEMIREFLNGAGLFPNDIDETKTKSKLLTLKNGVLIPALSISTATVNRVDIFQNDVEKIPVYYPNHPNSLMNFIFAGWGFNPQSIIEANFAHHNIDLNDFASYYIKTPEEAFRDLENGTAFITHYTGSTKEIVITDITLGYFLGQETQYYLMPIIVFHGRSDFYAFVSAIKTDWIE